MRQSGIDLGPGGLIRDDKKNDELLEELKETPVLGPKALLKLAKFYKAYPTNTPLADHLAFVALINIVNPRDLARELGEDKNKNVDLTSVTLRAKQAQVVPDDEPRGAAESASDIWEDFWDSSSNERKEKYSAAMVDIQWLPIAGIGLLIETPKVEDGQKKHHYVIGVSPDPDSLPSHR